MRKKVLFVCIHNSARSVMAAALMNRICGDVVEAQSAGLEPGTLNPFAVAALREQGIEIGAYQPRAVADVIASGQSFDIVVTVCDESSAQRCPMVPGAATRLHWGFPDPSALGGTDDQRLRGTCAIRDQIEAKIRTEFCPRYCAL